MARYSVDLRFYEENKDGEIIERTFISKRFGGYLLDRVGAPDPKLEFRVGHELYSIGVCTLENETELGYFRELLTRSSETNLVKARCFNAIVEIQE